VVSIWAGLTSEPEIKEQSESIFPVQRSKNGLTGSFKRTKENILPGASAHIMRTSLAPVFFWLWEGMIFTLKFEEITVSKILIQRHIEISTLSNHGGIEFLYSQNGHKVLRISDFEKLKLTQQFRYPYLDLDKRFDNVSESSKKIGILTSMNAQTLPLEFIVRNSKRIQMKGHAKQPHPQWLQSPVEAPQAPRLGIHRLFFRTHGASPAQVLPVLNHRDDVA
jgi:hypothetical protein